MKKKILVIGIIIIAIVGGSFTVNHFISEKNKTNDGKEVAIINNEDDDDSYHNENSKTSDSKTDGDDDSEIEGSTSTKDDKKDESDTDDSEDSSKKIDNPLTNTEDNNNKQNDNQSSAQTNKPIQSKPSNTQSNASNTQSNTSNNQTNKSTQSNSSTNTSIPKVVTHVVKFDTDGGTDILNQIIIDNETAYKPTSPTKTGYTFNGWLLNGVKYNFSTKVNGDITLKASWIPNKYTVTFKDGNTVLSTQTVNYNEIVSKPSNLTNKTGYTFGGWTLNGKDYNFDTKVNSSITLQAKWIINYYVVKFDSNGGSSVDNQIVSYNETASKPANPTRAGYTFDGWMIDDVSYNFNTKVTNNITLKAKWSISKYTVTFKDGDTVISSQDVSYNGVVTKPVNPSKAGYTFSGWLLNGNNFDFNTKITSSITLQAKWVINYYSVEFDSNGGSSVETILVSHNEKISEPTAPTRTGYTFAGWTLDGKSFDFNTKITSSITLKAEWIAGDYVVKFNSNGGSSVLSQAVSYNETATKPTNPTRTGYTFSGWTLNGESFDFNTKITNNITLTATWTINKYTVTFDSDGGSSVASQIVNYNDYVTYPGTPTKTGYTFGGWTLNGSIFYFNSSKVTSNITLKATWTLNKYTVTFDSDGGTSVASQTVSHNGVATQPSNPTKTGYTFNGWTLDGASYNFSTKVTKAITLKASWTINKYTVTFKDDNNVVATQTVNYNGTATNYTGVSKIGNRLAYWKLGDNKYDFSTKVTSNITLTAHWLPNFSGITECNVSSNLMPSSNYTTTDNSLKLYRCIVDYGMISPQNFAITSKYVYFNYAKDGAWTKTPEVDSELARVSRNYIYRITRSSNLTEYVKVEYAGHAQSFDVASDFVSLGDGSKIDQMYFNMFPTPQYSSDFDMSMAGYRGFGYNKFTTDGDTIYPEKSIAFDSNGKFSLLLDRSNYLSNGSVNESSFYSKVKSVGSNSNYLINPEIAVDEANNRVAFVSGKTVYFHSLSRLKAQETGSLISTFKISDSKQGVELDGNYLYIWTGEIGGAFVISKYDVTTGTKVKTATIDLTKYYTGLGRTKHEAEGISIYNGEIYVCAVSRTSSDTKIDVYQITGMN